MDMDTDTSAQRLPYNIVEGAGSKIFMWTREVPVEADAVKQLSRLSEMPFVFKHVAAMPDVHVGTGSTVGTVFAAVGAVIPAAVGVDIGCGMVACRLSLTAAQLPDNLRRIRNEIESMVPVGMADHNAQTLKSAVHTNTTQLLNNQFSQLRSGLDNIVQRHPAIESMARDANNRAWRQLGSLGGGNHFIELCTDENDNVWIMLHSGSRGIGNVIGRYFIELAKKDMLANNVALPDADLAYLKEGSQYYQDYVDAVEWAQEYAQRNRAAMLQLVLTALARHLPPFKVTKEAIQCHHNYISRETHYGTNVVVTRKGAVAAHSGVLGIIPGSMGAKSYIVRGLGKEESFCSCSHGAGRVMSRGAAKRMITVDDHIKATQGVECRKDEEVLDESPAAYKDIDSVMRSQTDLVEIVHTLKQVLCVKG